jgi:uncharacterized protein YqeY
MDLKKKLENAMKDAMRSGDDVTKRTVRMALAAIKQIEIDKQTTLDDTTILGIIQKEIKTRRESLEEARQANRSDLVASAEGEIIVLKSYLPEELSENDLIKIAREAIKECGATSPADMGKVMKILLPRIQGRAPGDRISQVVRQLLQA